MSEELMERMLKALDRIHDAGGFPEGFPSIPMTTEHVERIACMLEERAVATVHGKGDLEGAHKILVEKYEMKACPFCRKLLVREDTVT